jgi:hypothetical protein
MWNFSKVTSRKIIIGLQNVDSLCLEPCWMLLLILHTTHSLMLCTDSWLILTHCDIHVLIIRLFFVYILFYLILTQVNSGELKTLHKDLRVYVNAYAFYALTPKLRAVRTLPVNCKCSLGILLLHRAFRWFNYFHTPTYALVSYIIKLVLIIYIKTLYSLTAATCFDT